MKTITYEQKILFSDVTQFIILIILILIIIIIIIIMYILYLLRQMMF